MRPPATPFRLGGDAVSCVIDDIVRGPSAALTAVALVAGPEARASGWAAEAAHALAGSWPGPRRVVLADLDLAQPRLHLGAGLPDDEGVAELIEFGLSLAAVSRDVPGAGYALVTAGVYAPDPEATLRGAGWGRILREAAAERATLLAWVPAEAPGAEAVVERAGAVLVLAAAGEADAVLERLPRPYAVMAVLVPEEAATAGAAVPVPEESATPVQAAAEADEPLVTAAAAEQLLEPEGDEPVVTAAAPEEVLDAAVDEPVVAAAAAEEVLDAAAEEPVVAAAAAAEVVEEAAAGEVVEEPAGGSILESVAGRAARLSDDDFDAIRLPKDRTTRDALIAELRQRQREARMTPPDPGPWHGSAPETGRAAGPPVLLPVGESEQSREMRVEAAADDLGLETMEPLTGPASPRRRRYGHPLAWTIGVVLALSLLAGAWRFLAGRLEWRRAGGDAVVPAAAAPPVAGPEPVTVAPPAAQERPLPYAVALAVHVDLTTAAVRVDELPRGEAGLAYHVVPLEREGTLRYHLMAGPVPDSATALALRDTLVARRLKSTVTPTDVRHTPLAFLIGDYGTRVIAEQTVGELRRLDVPAYVVVAEAEDGAPLYRVYVGGFETPFEAQVTRQLLRAVGVRDSLVTRTGIFVP